MRKLNKHERATRRLDLIRLVDRELPKLIHVPVPASVRESEWFRDSGIEESLTTYAFPGYQLGSFSGKLLPALATFLMDEKEGKFEDEPTGVGATSGNFGKDAALIAPVFNMKGFCAVVNKGIPVGKLNHLHACGAQIEFAPDGIPATDYVYELAERPGYHLVDQYNHPGGIVGHKWTMDHIARRMHRITEEEEPDFILGAVAGTCSTLMAARQFLPAAKVMGVASMSKKEKVPGSRSPEDLLELQKIGGFYHRDEWRKVLSFPLITSVTRHEVFALNAELVQDRHITVGPTGALLMAGFYHQLRECVERDDLKPMQNKHGLIVACFVWIDSYLAYLDDPEYLSFFTK